MRVHDATEGVENQLTDELKSKIYERDKICQCCGADCPRSLTIDHAIPQSARVINEERNLQVLCFRCNSEKGPRSWWGPSLQREMERKIGKRFYKAFLKQQRFKEDKWYWF